MTPVVEGSRWEDLFPKDAPDQPKPSWWDDDTQCGCAECTDPARVPAILKCMYAKDNVECAQARCDECPHALARPTLEDPPSEETLLALGAPIHEHTDNVMHPAHYARWPMEPIEFIAINNLPWWLANVIKYTMRFDAKDGLQDLYKARSYLEMKIRQVEGEERFWDKPVKQERDLNDAGTTR